jgi:hypothetical protein
MPTAMQKTALIALIALLWFVGFLATITLVPPVGFPVEHSRDGILEQLKGVGAVLFGVGLIVFSLYFRYLDRHRDKSKLL